MVGFLSVVYSGFRTNHRVPSILVNVMRVLIKIVLNIYFRGLGLIIQLGGWSNLTIVFDRFALAWLARGIGCSLVRSGFFYPI